MPGLVFFARVRFHKEASHRDDFRLALQNECLHPIRRSRQVVRQAENEINVAERGTEGQGSARVRVALNVTDCSDRTEPLRNFHLLIRQIFRRTSLTFLIGSCRLHCRILLLSLWRSLL